MKNCRVLRILAFFTAAVSLASCGGKAGIKGNIKDLHDGEVIVKILDINQYNVVDTVTTDASGDFSYKMDMEKGQPEFVYLFHNDTRIASLLLERGDNVRVSADTSGNYTVEGSEESIRLAGVEKDFADFTAEFTPMIDSLSFLDASSGTAADLRIRAAKAYTSYYRSRVRYILENSHSLTVVPVLYQTIGTDLPVFSQQTDAIHFKNICDSLETVYPDSKYVKALKNEAKRRSDLLSLSLRLQSAPQLSYPDLDLPDVNAEKVRLSGVDAKVILLHFWTSSDPAQKMFNLDVLKPLYKKYHPKGLEIYQVALDTDKAGWARTVKDQGLEWINVCDGLGTDSSSILLYNLGALPVSFIISGGELVDGQFSDEASLRKLLDSLL